VFDIDMKNAEVSFQDVLDNLILSLRFIFKNSNIKPPLDLTKDITLCTSHDEDNNIFSAHVVLQRSVRRDNQDLQHLYNLLEQHMNPKYYQYIDKAFSSFSHNLQIVGFNRGGRVKKFQSSWTHIDQEIKTEFKVKYPAEAISILNACLISPCAMHDCKVINFNLHPKENKFKNSQLHANLDEQEIWQCLINKYPSYKELYTPQGFTSKGFYYLSRKNPGDCVICKRKHESIGAFRER